MITSESRRGNGAAAPSKMTADEVTGAFGPDSALRSMTGVGHAGIEQTTATGTRQTASGDRLQAEFAPTGRNRERAASQGDRAGQKDRKSGAVKGVAGVSEVQSAELDGHVVLFEQAAAKGPRRQVFVPARSHNRQCTPGRAKQCMRAWESGCT